jgi:UDP-N-acetylglucosamine--N-acetylmuramyl-(pentapeptide) pyrophosphoryl-undecaprenol N-acetylglucosamine transferase
MIERIILAGGGTGGHLFPGIAVMEELRRREPELDVLFVGTARGIETKVVPQLGERLECLEVTPLKGRTPGQLVKSLVALPQAGIEAARLVKQFRPNLVLGVGGYAAGPMVLAARALGVKTALLEQNAHVGLTNRLLSRFVDRAYLSFDETASTFSPEKARVVGNPVRRSFVSMGHMARIDPAAFEMRARRVLVIGGSQGARVLNQVVPEALARAGAALRGVEIVHQTGHAMCDAVRARYAELGLEANVTPFIDDMARAYASAAIVIGRAGATSLAEICAVGRPSVLVPFPAAADDHQWHNARALEARGAAVAIRESELDADKLAHTVARLLTDASERRRMADAARSMGRPDAAAAIVDDLCAWLGCASLEGENDSEGSEDEAGEPLDSAGEDSGAHRLERHYPPGADERLSMARRRKRRRSLAWSHADRYYGTRAVAALE